MLFEFGCVQKEIPGFHLTRSPKALSTIGSQQSARKTTVANYVQPCDFITSFLNRFLISEVIFCSGASLKDIRSGDVSYSTSSSFGWSISLNKSVILWFSSWMQRLVDHDFLIRFVMYGEVLIIVISC